MGHEIHAYLLSGSSMLLTESIAFLVIKLSGRWIVKGHEFNFTTFQTFPAKHLRGGGERKARIISFWLGLVAINKLGMDTTYWRDLASSLAPLDLSNATTEV